MTKRSPRKALIPVFRESAGDIAKATRFLARGVICQCSRAEIRRSMQTKIRRSTNSRLLSALTYWPPSRSKAEVNRDDQPPVLDSAGTGFGNGFDPVTFAELSGLDRLCCAAGHRPNCQEPHWRRL